MIDKMLNTVITVAVIVMIGLFCIALLKKEARPIAAIVLCVVWTFGGVFSFFKAVDYYGKERNQTYGEVVIHDPYENFNYYEYELPTIAFDKDKEGDYSYSITYSTTLKFDGDKADYTLLLNNRPCETMSASARLLGYSNILFYGIDGEIISQIQLDIFFVFTTSNIELTVWSDATDDNIGLLEEYVSVFGFKLRIIETVYKSEVGHEI